MIAICIASNHDWPITFGKVYFVIESKQFGSGYILTIKDDKFEIRDYHSNLFQLIK